MGSAASDPADGPYPSVETSVLQQRSVAGNRKAGIEFVRRVNYESYVENRRTMGVKPLPPWHGKVRPKAPLNSKSDFGTCEEALKKDGLKLKVVSKSHRANADLVLTAIGQHGDAMQFAASSLRRDKEFVLRALKKEAVFRGNALSYVDDKLKADEEVVSAGFCRKPSSLKHAAPALQAAPAFVLSLLPKLWKPSQALIAIPKELTGNPDFMLAVMDLPRPEHATTSSAFGDDGEKTFGSEVILYCDKELHSNKAFMLSAVKKDGAALRSASDSLKEDVELVCAAVNQDSFALMHAPPALQSNRSVILSALRCEKRHSAINILRVASEDIRKDREIVLAAIARSKGLYYGHEIFPTGLLSDKDIIFAAITSADSALHVYRKKIPPELQADKDILFAVAAKHGAEVFLYAPDILKTDKDVVLRILEVAKDRLYSGKVWEAVPPALKSDTDVLRALCLYNPSTMARFADKALVSTAIAADKEFMLPLLKRFGLVLRVCAPELKADRECVEASLNALKAAVLKAELVGWKAIEDHGPLLKYFAEPLRADRDLVLRATLQDHRTLDHAAQDLKEDEELRLIAQVSKLAFVSSMRLYEEYKKSQDAMTDLWTKLRPNADIVRQLLEFHPRAVADIGLSQLPVYTKKDSDNDNNNDNDNDNGNNSDSAILTEGPLVCAHRECMSAVIAVEGLKIRVASDELKADREIAMLAIDNSFGIALAAVAKEFRNDKAFVLHALEVSSRVRKNGSTDSVWKSVSEALRGDPDIAALMPANKRASYLELDKKKVKV